MALPGRPFARIGAVLKQIAPTLLAGFGGPAGALVASIAKKAMGDDTMTDDALQNAVEMAAGNSEGVAKLKQIEADLVKFELDNQLSLTQAENADRASARDRQIRLGDSMPAQVLYLTTLGFFGVLALLFFKGIPDSTGAKEVILIMVGALGGAWGSSVAYFVGSSAGSKVKTDILAATVKP